MASTPDPQNDSRSDKNGISYACKAMICCGMATDFCGHWRIEQLPSELQNVVAENRVYFLGTNGLSFKMIEDSSSSSSAAARNCELIQIFRHCSEYHSNYHHA